MAKFREMQYGNPMPEWQEASFVAANVDYETGDYALAVGPIRLQLTAEEAQRTMRTWEKVQRLNAEWRTKGLNDEDARMKFMAEEMAK